MTHDFFAQKAAQYEHNSQRVQNVDQISQAVLKHTQLHSGMRLLDFGAGTGLLLERVAPFVAQITAVDVSPSMTAQLRAKAGVIACELEIVERDLCQGDLPDAWLGAFDGVISSMTLHHIADIPALLLIFKRLVKAGGFIALADLDSEDGSFHTEDTGVFHHGFDRAALSAQAQAAGFVEVNTFDASVMQKPHGAYSVFVLVANQQTS